jgi:hypothetical protein
MPYHISHLRGQYPVVFGDPWTIDKDYIKGYKKPHHPVPVTQEFAFISRWSPIDYWIDAMVDIHAY